ncbi:MAG: DUF3226 domain-containing protein [Anaerolineales bacterium]
MRNYGFMVVEGKHDVAFLVRLFKKRFGLKQIEQRSGLDSYWHPLLNPKERDQDSIQKRASIPEFCQNDTHSIAIYPAGGIDELAKALVDKPWILDDTAQITSYGMMLDADDTTKQLPQKRFDELINELKKLGFVFIFPSKPGEITKAEPAFGIYVLPDNQRSGTLEDILLQTAQVNYASLCTTSFDYVNTVEKLSDVGEFKKFSKPSGKNKAHVSSISSILNPGMAIQNTIRQDQWLEGESLKLKDVETVSNFLAELFQLG